jgi:hypothetical protein
MSTVEPQGSNNRDNPSIRSGGFVAGGSILLAIGIILAMVCLPMAFEDPSTSCQAAHDCTALVDFRPIGWTGVVIALIVGVPGAWMLYSGSRLSDEPQ